MAIAVANRYSSALTQVLAQPGAGATLEDALAQLEAFQKAYAASPELRAVLAAPSVQPAKKRSLTAAIAERLEISKPIRNLLFVMLDNGRIGLLPSVIDAVRERLDARGGIERIEIVSAVPLDDAQREDIVQKFRAITGKEVDPAYRLDGELLGGVLVRAGSMVYDGSLRSQLLAMDRAMAGAA